MENNSSLPIVRSLQLPQCRHLMCWSIPYSMLFISPFACVFTYYNTQNQQRFMKWNVKTLFRDLAVFWTISTMYGMIRTFLFDPYCDPSSVHYDKSLSAFERRKTILKTMNETLELEGKIDIKNPNP